MLAPDLVNPAADHVELRLVKVVLLRRLLHRAAQFRQLFPQLIHLGAELGMWGLHPASLRAATAALKPTRHLSLVTRHSPEMSLLSANVRRSAAEATLTLPFRVPPQEWFTLRQAGAVLGLAESTVEKLYDQGLLTGHSHNAGRGERSHKRVLRAALLAYAIRTADYTDDSLADAFEACLDHLPAATLLRIAARSHRLAQEKL